jgi:ABC-type transporter Mla subunit MlaD
MMLSRRHWWLVVVLTATGLSVATALAAGFVPGPADFTDPLGRPAALARSIAGSAAAVDTLAADIHDKHRGIAETSATLAAIADHLDQVVAESDPIGPLITDAHTRTDELGTALRPLPPLVAVLTGHVDRATVVSDHLGSNVGTVGQRLSAITGRLSAVTGDLGPLAPRAAKIASVLRQLQRDTTALRPLGPVLGRVGPTLGGPGP